ncbi:MarR family transcriptional regulator [Pandoraea sputorum]|uniref:MarR family transcriptional regulator n=2 Tax=Pandoraea sputorum TaxID=93222 RepID=A0A5E5ARW4_9BURK|nr:MarR family transcriptional regulator [Pandoraea sputorum]
MALVRCLRREAAAQDAPPSHTSLLGAIERFHGDATPSILCEAEGLSEVDLNVLLNRMEDEGLVLREADRDACRTRIGLTERGRKALQANRLRRDQWLADMIRTRLSARERWDLLKAGELMERLALAAEQDSHEAGSLLRRLAFAADGS